MGPKNQAQAASAASTSSAPFNPGYDATLAAAGRNPSDHQIASMQVIHVSDSTDRAWEIAGPGLEYFVNFYETAARTCRASRRAESARITQEMIRSGNAGFWSAAVGTPDDVINALGSVRARRYGSHHRAGVRVPPPGHAQRRGAQVDAAVPRPRAARAAGDRAKG